jgi:hypothetical protein
VKYAQRFAAFSRTFSASIFPQKSLGKRDAYICFEIAVFKRSSKGANHYTGTPAFVMRRYKSPVGQSALLAASFASKECIAKLQR